MKKNYLGIDIGSVSIKFAVIDGDNNVLQKAYFRVHGNVIKAIRKILKEIKVKEVRAIATTGSARRFVGQILKADSTIDEITAHRTAVKVMYPKAKTIFEIGGQDSKLIYFTNKMVNFEMNNVCAAGTGSFLDQQASRLEMKIDKFFKKGLKTQDFHAIASKCTVFAETDMIHAQQAGVPLDKIIRGVHRGMVNNYYAQLCRGKELKGDFLFEGGTSENDLLVEELAYKLIENNLIKSKNELIVPKPYNGVMGAIGAAIVSKNLQVNNVREIPRIKRVEYLRSEKCYQCANQCGADITIMKVNGEILTIGKQCQE